MTRPTHEDWLRADLVAAEALLSQLPPDEVLTRRSMAARVDALRERLAPRARPGAGAPTLADLLDRAVQAARVRTPTSAATIAAIRAEMVRRDLAADET